MVASGRYDNGNSFETGPYKIAVRRLQLWRGRHREHLPDGIGLQRRLPGQCRGHSAGLVVTFPIAFTCE